MSSVRFLSISRGEVYPVAPRVGTVTLGAIVQQTVHADVARPRLEMQQHVAGAFEGVCGVSSTTTAVVTLQKGPAEELLDRAAASVGSGTRALLDAQGVPAGARPKASVRHPSEQVGGLMVHGHLRKTGRFYQGL